MESTLQPFLDELASNAPTPGGGSAGAAAGAMGAALVSMVCNLTIGKEKFLRRLPVGKSKRSKPIRKP
mgnify:CR=1 FL=1